VSEAERERERERERARERERERAREWEGGAIRGREECVRETECGGIDDGAMLPSKGLEY
jgi:hypothetical protein